MIVSWVEDKGREGLEGRGEREILHGLTFQVNLTVVFHVLNVSRNRQYLTTDLLFSGTQLRLRH